MRQLRRRSALLASIVLAGATGLLPSAGPAPARAGAEAPSVTWDGPHPIGDAIWDVVADQGGWIATGYTDRGPGIGGYAPAAWTSADGRAWSAATVEPRDEESFEGYELWATARLGDTLYNLGVKVGHPDIRNIRGWQSTDDGATWDVIESTEGIYAEGFIGWDAASNGTMLVAAEYRFTRHTGRLWTYTEEAGWVDTTPEAVGPDASGMQINSVIQAGGTFIAVGTRGTPSLFGDDENPPSGASWTSTNGVTWTSSPASPLLVDHALTSVAARPGGGYVAIGYDDAGMFGESATPQAWISSDGLTWTEVSGPTGDPGSQGRGIVAISGGLLAITATPNFTQTQAWTSADGTAWQLVGIFDHAPRAVASNGSEVVVATTFGHPTGGSDAYVHHGVVGPPAAEEPATFTDIEDSPFREDIEWIAAEGITTGCAPSRFCPDDPVLREQMASFLARAFGFEETSTDFFTDDEGSMHEVAINRVAAAGVTTGCGSGRFCPSSPVTRAQMASFLVRAVPLPPATRDWFTDDDGSPHEDDINRLREAGITNGCGGTSFCPAQVVPREQMAAFLHRALR